MPPKLFDKTAAAANRCEEAREQFFSQMEGLLSPEQEAALRTHIHSCEACQREWSQYRLLESQLRAAREAIPAAGDLSAGFYQKLARERRKVAPRPLRVFAPAFATAALAIVLWQTTNRHGVRTVETPLATQGGLSKNPTQDAPPALNENDVAYLLAPSDAEENAPPALKNANRQSVVRSKRDPFAAKVRNKTTVQPIVVASLNSEQTSLEGVDLEVKDDERGFESKVHIGGGDALSRGVRTVTINDEGEVSAPVLAIEQN